MAAAEEGTVDVGETTHPNNALALRKTSQCRANRSSIFHGNTEEMNGHVSECASEQGDKGRYAKTVEALE